MKLKEAKFCLECEEIFPGPGEECPKCGRSTSVWISRWLLPRARHGAARRGRLARSL